MAVSEFWLDAFGKWMGLREGLLNLRCYFKQVKYLTKWKQSENVLNVFIFSKEQIMFWSWEGMGVVNPTHVNFSRFEFDPVIYCMI